MESDKYKIQVIGHSKKDGHTEYVISVEKNGSTFTFTERYSGLRNLSEAMRKSTNKGNFPKFPPKKFFGGDDEKFLSKRQQELNNYFELISKDTDFTSLPPFVKFIKEKKEKEEKKENINKINTQQVKKEVEKVEEKEKIRSFQEIDNECKKIVKDYNPLFYYMSNFYDKESENNNTKFIKFFKSNKIVNNENESNIMIDKGEENNFDFINKDENHLDSIENNIKEKIGKVSELCESLEGIYSTEEIVVPI